LFVDRAMFCSVSPLEDGLGLPKGVPTKRRMIKNLSKGSSVFFYDYHLTTLSMVRMMSA
jgi:hypothetical protein